MHVATLRERIVYGVVLKEAASFSLYKRIIRKLSGLCIRVEVNTLV